MSIFPFETILDAVGWKIQFSAQGNRVKTKRETCKLIENITSKTLELSFLQNTRYYHHHIIKDKRSSVETISADRGDCFARGIMARALYLV